MGYKLHWEHRGVVKQFSGLVTGSDIAGSVHDVHSAREFDALRFVINDFLDTQAVDFSDLDIEFIAAVDKAAFMTNSKIKVAVVALDPQIQAIALEYANSPLNAYPTRLFDNMADAELWAKG
jgi:hypothetical protein